MIVADCSIAEAAPLKREAADGPRRVFQDVALADERLRSPNPAPKSAGFTSCLPQSWAAP